MATPANGQAAMWSRLYNALWYPALPVALFASTGRDRQSRRERLGNGSYEAVPVVPSARRVWVHAASVGEVEAVRPVVLGLERALRDLDFTITTMTAAGRDAARRRVPGTSQLAPFDHVSTVRAFLSRIRPTLVLIAETELWPNFFLQSAEAGARIAIVNGRLSERSMSSYRLIRPLIGRLLSRTDLILVQTSDDALRFSELGAPSERLSVTGNTKVDLDAPAPPLRAELADFAAGQPILVAGSTGPEEERTVLAAYRALRARFPTLALVIAPRHLNRLDKVKRDLCDGGFEYVLASELSQSRALAPSNPVLLLDTMGELRGLYSRSAIAFVGGSLAPGRGGQSLAEPAIASVPVIFGPHYENHREVGNALIAAGAARVAGDAAQLQQACADWLDHPSVRAAAGDTAREVMERMAGGATETVRHLLALLAA